MKTNSQKLYVWCGPAMLVIVMVGVVIAGWLPPPGPNQSALQVAHDFQQHTTAIRVGMAVAMLGSALLGPFVAVLASQVKRMDESFAASAYCQLGLGSLFILEFIFPLMILEVAAFRPYRSPAITQTLNDLAWILIVATVSTAVLELLLLAVAIVNDRNESPVFPRWAASFNAVIGIVFGFGIGAIFTKHGVFAWDGLMAFWLPLGTLGLWVVVMTGLLLRAVSDPVTTVAADAN